MNRQTTDPAADNLDLDCKALMSKALSLKAEMFAFLEPFDFYYGHLFRPYTEVLEPNLKKELEDLKEALLTIERLYHLLEARQGLYSRNDTTANDQASG